MSLRTVFHKWIFQKASALAPLYMGGLGPAIWSPNTFESYAKEAYYRNVISYRCIDEISKCVASVNWKLMKSKGGDRTEVDTHPVLELFERPNPYESFQYYMLKLTAFLVLGGTVYTERISPTTGPNRKIPMELYAHRPDIVQINVNKNTGLLDSYTVMLNGKKMVFEIDPITQQGDLMQIKLLDPLDPWHGSAPTRSASYEIDSHNEAISWNKSLLENQARPGLVMSFDKESNISTDEFDKLERLLAQKMSGSLNAGKNMLITGGIADIKELGLSPKEMDWLEGNNATARNICLGYGVPPQLIGIPGDNTYNTYREARMAFWESTVVWYLTLVAGEWNNWFFEREEGLKLIPDLDSHPAFEPRRADLWKRLEAATDMTINEKRRAKGMDDIEGGDVLLVPANMLPLGEEPDLDEGEPNDDDEDDE